MSKQWKYISPQLASDIREYIKEQNMFLKEFADNVLEVSYSTLNKVLTDILPLTTKLAVKLSDNTDMTLEYIYSNANVEVNRSGRILQSYNSLNENSRRYNK